MEQNRYLAPRKSFFLAKFVYRAPLMRSKCVKDVPPVIIPLSFYKKRTQSEKHHERMIFFFNVFPFVTEI